MRIGFLGTGLMGAHMARRLAAAGHAVAAWNRAREKAERLRAHGVAVADAAADVAGGAEAVVCMLSSGPVCDAVLLGEGGVLAAMAPGSTLVVMSSIPPATARGEAERAAARGVGYLDAPVSGGEAGARDGTLAIMAGGEADTFERVRPVLEAMGRPTLVGPAGSGSLSKLANQVIVGGTLALVAEALTLAERGGADPARVIEALRGGFADSLILQVHGQRMIEGDFTPGGPSKHQLKDLVTAAEEAAGLRLRLELLGLVRGLYAGLVDGGGGDLDHSAIIREVRRRGGG